MLNVSTFGSIFVISKAQEKIMKNTYIYLYILIYTCLLAANIGYMPSVPSGLSIFGFLSSVSGFDFKSSALQTVSRAGYQVMDQKPSDHTKKPTKDVSIHSLPC